MSERPPIWRDRPFLLAMALVTIAGAALRLYQLDQLPPGLAFDEAWEGLDGRRILEGARPVFLPENNGREPAFAYTVALTIGLLGPTTTAVRAAAAIWGIATIPAMALLGGALGGRHLALVAAALIALSYWPIHLSRVGLRPVALPPLEAVGIALLLVALGVAAGVPNLRPRLRWLTGIGAGVALGLQLYTYLPARLTLAVAAFASLAALLAHLRRPCWRSTLGTAVLAAVLAGVVAVPLGRHYLRHPEDWLGRAGQVSVMNAIRTGADPVATIGGNARDTLAALVLRGDMQARHNLPGRPIFDGWSFAFFVVGLGAAWRRLGRLAAATVYVWLALMLVPAVLSDSAPHFLRAAGALPPLFLLGGLGLVVAVETVARWLRRTDGWSYRLAAVPLALTGLFAAQDYFGRFADPAVSAAPFEADVAAIAQQVATTRPAEPMVGPIEPAHPALRFLVPGEPPATFPVQALPLRPGTYYLRDREGEERLAGLRAAFPNAVLRPLAGATEVAVPADAVPRAPTPRIASRASFGAVELLGVDATTAPAGTELPLRLYWRANQTPGERLTVFVHVVDASGVSWAQEDLEPGAGGYPTSGWRGGEVVIDERRLPLAPGIPPGEYTLRLGLVRPGGARLPLVGSPGDFAALGPVRVERSAGRLNLWRLPLTARPEQELAAGETGVQLVGYRLEAERIEAGQSLPLWLAWEWRGPAAGAQLEVSLGGAARAFPLGGVWPSDRWSPGEFVQQRVTLPIAPDAPPGEAELSVRLVSAGGERSQPVGLGRVRVENRPRSFAAPAPSVPIGARFGDFAELVGFDPPEGRAAPGAQLRVTLQWRARATAEHDYVVFLHLVDAEDRVRGQVDSPPAGGAAPTRSWLPAEVIRDERTLTVAADAPPGDYRLAVGLYRPDTGQRVPLADGSGDRLLFGRVTVGP